MNNISCVFVNKKQIILLSVLRKCKYRQNSSFIEIWRVVSCKNFKCFPLIVQFEQVYHSSNNTPKNFSYNVYLDSAVIGISKNTVICKYKSTTDVISKHSVSLKWNQINSLFYLIHVYYQLLHCKCNNLRIELKF